MQKKSPALYGICLLGLLASGLPSSAQSGAGQPKVPVLQKIPYCFVEPWYRRVDTDQVIHPHAYGFIVSQLFGTIAGVQSGGLASAGSFDPVAGTFSLTYAQQLSIPRKVDISKLSDSTYCNTNTNELKPYAKRSWFLAFSAGGGIIGNNIGVLFNNSSFNSGATFTGKLLIPLNNSIIIGGNDRDSVFKKKQAIEYQRWSDKMKIWRAVNSSRTQLNLDETATKLAQEKLTVSGLRTQSEAVKKELDLIAAQKPPDPAKYMAYRLKLADSLLSLLAQADSLERDRLALQLKQDSLSFIAGVILADEEKANSRSANWANYGERQYQKIDTFYDRLLDTVEINAAFIPYTLRWLGIVGSFNRNSYYTYYDSLPFSSRLSSNTLSVFNVGLEFNLIHYNPVAMHYINIGLLRIRNNNISDLSTSAVSIKTQSSLVDTTQKVTAAYNAYTSPITEYEAWNPHLNYYLFLGQHQQQGLHLNVQAEFRTSGQNPVNLGLGYIFSFKNSKDASVLNVEAYIKFQDLFKALPNEEAHFYSRNMIGLLFGIPINFPTTK